MSVQPAAILGQVQTAAGHPMDGVRGQRLHHQGQAHAEAVPVFGERLGNFPGVGLSKDDGFGGVCGEVQIGLGQGRAEVLSHLIEVVTGGRKE